MFTEEPMFTKSGIVDTLLASKILRKANFSKSQAETIVGIIKKSQENSISKEEAENKLSTKEDIKHLEISTKKEIKELEISTKKEIKELEISTKKEIEKIKKETDEIKQETDEIKQEITKIHLTTERLNVKIEKNSSKTDHVEISLSAKIDRVKSSIIIWLTGIMGAYMLGQTALIISLIK